MLTPWGFFKTKEFNFIFIDAIKKIAGFSSALSSENGRRIQKVLF
jgi:hypothetical protein